MNTKYYKAASERTDADERALIPAFERTASERAELYQTLDATNDTNTIASTPESEPAPNKAQHSPLPEIPYYDETTPLKWGAYDQDGKLRASFDSESEAMHYTRNRGHMDGGTYKLIVASVNGYAQAIEACRLAQAVIGGADTSGAGQRAAHSALFVVLANHESEVQP